MSDPFAEKRGMVQMLMKMLKKHASDEVGNGLAKPEGEGDMHGLQTEKVMSAEHDMDHPTPEHDVETKELHSGGVVEKVSPTIPPMMDSEEGQPDKEGAVHKEAMVPLEAREAAIPEEEQEPHDSKYADAPSEPSSMFESFLKRKKK